MIVQIYEIQTPEEAERCIELGVEHIGSVILSKELLLDPGLRDVVKVCREGGARSVLLPLFEEKEAVFRSLEYYTPDYVHFCQDLTRQAGRGRELEKLVSYQAAIKESFPEIGLIRTIPVPKKGVEAPLLPYPDIITRLEEFTDFFLIDTWSEQEPVKGYVGITGTICDWDKAKEIVQRANRPVILAGGISPANARDAIMEVVPAGVDSCTRTNRTGADGRAVRFQKDFVKVRKLLEEVRRAEKDLIVKKQEIEKELQDLERELKEREAALPPHSVRPHQLQRIEELEELIEERKNDYQRLLRVVG